LSYSRSTTAPLFHPASGASEDVSAHNPSLSAIAFSVGQISCRGRTNMLEDFFAHSSTLVRNERVKLAATFWSNVAAGMLIGGVAGAFFFEKPLFWGKVGIAIVGTVLAYIYHRIGNYLLDYMRAP